MRRYWKYVVVVALLAVALFAVACGGDDTSSDGDGTGTAALSGDIRIDGSSTVGPLTEAAAEFFQGENPDVRVTVGISGTGGGFEKFCAGETDANDASRQIEPDEEQICTDAGVEWVEMQVANDGIAVVINPENDWADTLTVEQLKMIWNEGSTIDNWNQVDPSFPDVPLELFGPGTDSGTFDYFTDAINGEEGVSRTDYQATEDDNVAVQGVSGSKGGMAYFGLSYYEQNAAQLKVVAVDGGGPRLSRPCSPASTRRSAGLSSSTRRSRPCSGPRWRPSCSSTWTTPRASPSRPCSCRSPPSRPQPRRRCWTGSSAGPRRAPSDQHMAVTTTQRPASMPASRPLEGLEAGSRRYREKVIVGSLFACAALSIVLTLGIVLALLIPSLEFFGEVNPIEFFTGTEWAPLFKNSKFGVLPLLGGTLVVTLIAAAICLPLGLLAAIYLSEYAARRTRSVVKPILEILAGIPTVVYGFFALTFITPLLRDNWLFGTPPGVFNALSAGLVMGIMILPTVASISEDAMYAVPQSLRAGAAALGATKYEISTRVVVPAGLSGIIAAFVLGISRAVGETMIVLIAAGGMPNLTFNPIEAMQTMTAFIGAAGLGDQATGSIGYKTIFAVGISLFVMTLIMNIISIRLVRKYREVYD